MTLTPCTRLGSYEIVAKLGEGGMGEVYRARDPRLGREVAVKVVSGGAVDANRLARFAQEARAAASLNHPHILTVHDVGTADVAGVATPYVVSELLEGESLRARVARGKLPTRVATELAIQIARALAAAHTHGIVHRDIKPENVFVTKDGAVKVLDFGLAKLRESTPAAFDGSTTEGGVATGPGVVLGTVGYMAPEQVRGEAVDARADLFALGCVLYELVTGQRAFEAGTAVETLSAILHREPPDLATHVPGVSGGLERIVRRCLEKDAAQRFQSAQDLAFALEAINDTRSSSSDGTTPTMPGPGRRRERVVLGAAAVALALAGWSILAPKVSRGLASSLPLFADLSLPSDVAFDGSLTVSPDGAVVVFVGVQDGETALWRRPLHESDARRLEGTRGAAMPFWSSDGRTIAFFAAGKLRTIPAEGGPVVDVCDVVGQPRGGTWSPSGTIVFAREGGVGLERITSDGSDRRSLTEALPGERHEHPMALADGSSIAFTVFKGPFVSSLAEVHLVSPDGGPSRQVTRDARKPWTTATHVVFVRGSALVARPLDPGPGSDAGERVLATDVADSDQSRRPFALAAGGALVYARQSASSGVTRLTWLDRAGRVLSVVGEPGRWSNVEPSPKGDRFVLTQVDPERGQPELWLFNPATDQFSRLSGEPGRAGRALWAPDGLRVLHSFTPSDAARSALFVRPADGSAPPRPIVERSFDIYPDGWSVDGRYVLYASRNTGIGAGGADLWKADLEGEVADAPFAQTKFDETQAHVSPNGRWVAYVSNESGRLNVYVAPFAGAGRWQVSTDGAQTPRWRADGRELYYLALDGALYAVRVDPSAQDFTVGPATRLFDAGLAGGIPRYAFSADGQRVLAAVPTSDPRTSLRVAVVTNWESLLERR